MTNYAIEMKCNVNTAVTVWEAENWACSAIDEEGTTPQRLSAWKDGSNWLEADGTEVGWLDWPPGGVQ